jgi:hypothetical protein
MADNWLSVVTKCSEGDRNEDEVVDFFDFAILANHWFLEEYP